MRDQELKQLAGIDADHYHQAAEILDRLTLSEVFVPFLTFLAYAYLD